MHKLVSKDDREPHTTAGSSLGALSELQHATHTEPTARLTWCAPHSTALWPATKTTAAHAVSKSTPCATHRMSAHRDTCFSAQAQQPVASPRGCSPGSLESNMDRSSMLSRLPSSSGWGPGKKARSRANLSSMEGKQHDSTEVMEAAASRIPACVLHGSSLMRTSGRRGTGDWCSGWGCRQSHPFPPSALQPARIGLHAKPCWLCTLYLYQVLEPLPITSYPRLRKQFHKLSPVVGLQHLDPGHAHRDATRASLLPALTLHHQDGSSTRGRTKNVSASDASFPHCLSRSTAVPLDAMLMQ